MYEETLKLLIAKLGADHSDTLMCQENLAGAYASAGRIAEAVPLFEETLRLRTAKFGHDHPDTFPARNNLATAYSETGRMDEAITLNETTVKLATAKLGQDHPDTLGAMNNLARCYIHAKRWSDAEKIARICLSVRKEERAPDWMTYYTMCQLGAALAGQNQLTEAESFMIDGYEGMKALESTMSVPDRRLLADSVRHIVKVYSAWNKPEKAAEWKAKIALPDLPANVFAGP